MNNTSLPRFRYILVSVLAIVGLLGQVSLVSPVQAQSPEPQGDTPITWSPELEERYGDLSSYLTRDAGPKPEGMTLDAAPDPASRPAPRLVTVPEKVEAPEGLSPFGPVEPEGGLSPNFGLDGTDVVIHSLLADGGFENFFWPWGAWSTYDNNGGTGGDVCWDDGQVFTHSGGWDIQPATGCANGTADGAAYLNNMDSRAKFGPFNLVGMSAASLDFWVWNDSESGFDYFTWWASADNATWSGFSHTGNDGAYIYKSLDLTPYVGDASVWIEFVFSSDSSNVDWGPYVDDVTITGSHAFEFLAPADFDGNKSTDVSVYRSSGGTWYVKDQFYANYGLAGDLPVPGDYNQDGTADVAVYRPSEGHWYIKDQFHVGYGLPGDIPVPGDYNGGGATDIAVYRPSTGTWYNWSNGTVTSYGLPGDIPIPGDYDCDGATNIAVYRPSTGTWYFQNGALGGYVNYGLPGDIPVIGDFNGGCATDIAIYRPSTGSWANYSNATFVNYGIAGDIPVPGDYNGNFSADIAVYRPSTGTWYVKDQFFTNYGFSTDYPLPVRDTNADGDPYN